MRIPTEVIMLRKVLTVSVMALFLGTSVVSAPAQAATIKSGQSCKPLNAKKTVTYKGSKYVYNCVKNPYYLKTKLTWTLQECLTAIKEEKTSKKDLATQKSAGGDPQVIDMYQQLLDMSVDLRKASCAKGI